MSKYSLIQIMAAPMSCYPQKSQSTNNDKTQSRGHWVDKRAIKNTLNTNGLNFRVFLFIFHLYIFLYIN